MTTPTAVPEGGWTVATVAAELLRCEDERVERPPFTDEWPDLDLDTGYEIQDLNLTKRLDRGERLIGVKLGLTSRAKQERMGVHFPFVAWLTDAMVLPVGDPVPQGKLIHPRIEPEIVFVMGDRLEGPGVTCAQAMGAVETVWGGAEVTAWAWRRWSAMQDRHARHAGKPTEPVEPAGMRASDAPLGQEAFGTETPR